MSILTNKDGADTVEKVGQIAGAGTGEDCGRCKYN